MTTSPLSSIPSTSAMRARFLSQDECRGLVQRVSRLTSKGRVELKIGSFWRGWTRWARNRIAMGGDMRSDEVQLRRWLPRGTIGIVQFNMTDDQALEAALRRAERLANITDVLGPAEVDRLERGYREHDLKPMIWSDATYGLDAEAQAMTMRSLAEEAEREGLLSFGYVEASAHGQALMGSEEAGWSLYYPYTNVQYSVTVRDPKGVGSGWAGQDHYDWTKIDASNLTRRAIEKCLASRNPVAVEPGRYTTILEPQALADFINGFFHGDMAIDRIKAENGQLDDSPFDKQEGESRLGEKMFDERLTFRTDLMDPDLGFPPWRARYVTQGVDWLHPVTWVQDGVLQNLSYHREYALRYLGTSTGMPNYGAYRMETNGPVTPLEEMIATTRRGILVTRFWGCTIVHVPSWSITGMTRDGLWLIEHGKIRKPIKNFRFYESLMAKLNAPNLEQIGTPVRVLSPEFPVVVPPIKVRDFNFTALTDAV